MCLGRGFPASCASGSGGLQPRSRRRDKTRRVPAAIELWIGGIGLVGAREGSRSLRETHQCPAKLHGLVVMHARLSA